MTYFNRRGFIRTSVLGGAAVVCANPLNGMFFSERQETTSGSRVAISRGIDRADAAFKALQPFSKEIKRAIGNRRVVLKVNNVLIYVPLSSTHAETLEGILEFLKSINKSENVVIAESSASDSTLQGFDNYGYFRLLSKYPVKLMDLDAQPFEIMHVVDERDFRPHPIRVSSVITDPDSYVVSVARMKTHNTVGATLSLKNIVLGSPIKDPGFTLYNEDKRFTTTAKESKQGTVSYKRLIHGSGYHAINYNIASLAPRLHPHLALIDGFIGMEGNGPTLGTPIEHGVCVASTDWLAADRIGVELMGIDYSKIGYLNHCATMGLGTADLSKIEIVGENLKDNIKHYKVPDNFERQASWRNAKS